MSEIEYRVTKSGVHTAIIRGHQFGVHKEVYAHIQSLKTELEDKRNEVEILANKVNFKERENKQLRDMVESLRHIHGMPDEAIEKIDIFQLLNQEK